MLAVAYVRVSTDEQVQGTSLDTQKQACLEKAKAMGLRLSDENVFREEGESAKFADRPELIRMLRFCKDNKGRVTHCIVWKVDRLARDTDVHSVVKVQLSQAGVKLVSVTEPISDDPMGKAMEGMLAVFAQLDNDVRTARTTQGMKARTEQGGWVHGTPPGYRKAKTLSGVPTIEPDELAPNVVKLLSLYSKGGYTVAQAVKLAFELGIRTNTGQPRAWQSIKNILSNPLYAGFISTKFTDGKTIKGVHKPLISEETYYKIQHELKSASHNFSRSSEADWVLRGGFLIHSKCGHPLTGSSPRGRSGPSPRYHCTKCKASEIGEPVSKKREEVHHDFMQLLNDIRPDEGTVRLFKEMALRRWNDAYKESRQLTRKLQQELEAGNSRKSRLTDLYLDGKVSDVEYENKKQELEESIAELKLRHIESDKETNDKERVIDDALLFMTSPGLYWNQAPLEIKRRVQDSILPTGIEYDFKTGFGTARLAKSYLLIQKIAENSAKNPNVVAVTGIEPVTSGL